MSRTADLLEEYSDTMSSPPKHLLKAAKMLRLAEARLAEFGEVLDPPEHLGINYSVGVTPIEAPSGYGNQAGNGCCYCKQLDCRQMCLHRGLEET